jgi:stage V sporulation protein AC
MEVTGQEYRQMNKKAAPKSPVLLNCLKAFLIGGLICTIAEVIVELLMNFAGMEQKEARLIGSISLIFLSVLLTGFNVYDNIAKHAGAGTLVPITGFANAVVSPAIEFKSEGLVLGLGAKMFSIAGPVLVYGISASILYGLILCLLQLF